ncbi:MAG: ABC transporter related protein [Clostridia bacterium 62_21]|nr:MAG: ABC transporter related protein [Clostridia bacterium 62_21]
MALLEARRICAGYGDVVVVEDVSLHVDTGHLVAIVGPNGSGKSTLLKSLLGLARRFAGEVVFQGQDISGMPTWKAAEIGIGYVPQVNNVFTNLSVIENLEMGGYCRRDKAGVRDDLGEMLKTFPELEARKHACAGTLSGGERQLLAIARAMMTHPKVLLLDEPLAFLSPKAASLILERLLQIRATGTAILLVEQNTIKALEVANYGYVLNEGRCVMEGEGPALLADESLRRRFLGLGREREVKSGEQ